MLMVVLASLLPVSGQGAVWFSWLTKAAIALLFFLHGARLPREQVVAGLVHWRLHITVLAFTFVVFPLLGLLLVQLPEALLPAQLAAGVLYLCLLPSTVQSSIAFTSQARGNVAAAVVAASASNLIGRDPDTAAGRRLFLHTTTGGDLAEGRPGRGGPDPAAVRAGPAGPSPCLPAWVARNSKAGQLHRPGFDPAGGLRGLQRRRGRRTVEAGQRPGTDSASGHLRGVADRGAHHERCWPPECLEVQQGGRDRRGLLRLQEGPGHRRTYGQHPVSRRHASASSSCRSCCSTSSS